MLFIDNALSPDARRAPRAQLARAGVLSCTLLACASLQAQERDASDWQHHPSELACVPDCRDGFECRQGECIPVCAPGCQPGFLCTAGGACVRTGVEPPLVRAPAPRSSGGADAQCIPSCRSGFTCLGGQCVSVCNPACAIGEYCTEAGECVSGEPPVLMSVPEGAPVPAQEPARSNAANSLVNLHLDVLGALQFGLSPTVEVGKRVSGYLSVQPLNTGVASYFLLGRDRDDALYWGLGTTLGLHVFGGKDGNMRGLFGGPALQYLFYATRDLKRDLADYRTHALSPQLDLGYRWAFGHFLLGLGGRVGLLIPVADHAEPISRFGCARPDSCDERRDLKFLAGVFLDLGWFL